MAAIESGVMAVWGIPLKPPEGLNGALRLESVAIESGVIIVKALRYHY